jgi:diguanylate cyclase (GGDEF)-like protein
VLSERVRSDNEFIASSLGVLRQAQHNALTDGLTGLGNRHWMKDMFEREVTRARTSGHSLCLMMIDIDRFKTFNDQYGHIAGDRVLVAVSEALRGYLRPTDLIARFGGDEFAVLLPGIELGQAHQTAERLRQHVAGLSPPSLSTAITISIGVSTNHPDDVGALVQRADAAMYEAKGKDATASRCANLQILRLSISRARPSCAAASTTRSRGRSPTSGLAGIDRAPPDV